MNISIHAPSRERHQTSRYRGADVRFQSTLPRGSDLLPTAAHRQKLFYFNPRSLAGATLRGMLSISRSINFNPRSLAGATPTIFNGAFWLSFQSTLPRGSDPVRRHSVFPCAYFNPRSLAGATVGYLRQCADKIFQSTLPRGSDIVTGQGDTKSEISIHAPSRERPSLVSFLCPASGNFNPRSLAGATVPYTDDIKLDCISIHAPSRERRSTSASSHSTYSSFQSTLPRGSDLTAMILTSCHAHFNPRSLAGATTSHNYLTINLEISIHAPSRERRQRLSCTNLCRYFNPRSLAGATRCWSVKFCNLRISIHAPSRERRNAQ